MERDDVELINNVLSGDETAFNELVKKYQKSVHALAWRKIGDYHIAEEITQDTFLQAHNKLATLKNKNQFAGWLYVIADRRCKAWFRKKKMTTQSLEATSEETLEKTAFADYVCVQREDTAIEHRRKIVKKLMEKLPESERTVMVLHYLGEMSCEAISKFLGVSPNTVKSRLQRARKRLQNQEHIIRETLGGVPLRPDLTEIIMQRIDSTKETIPSGGKPLLPFAAIGASVIFVLLLIGVNKQFITNFQKPYSLKAHSEPTIEIVDAPVVLDIQSKPELKNRVSGTNQSKNNNNGLTTGTKTVENNSIQDAMQWNLPDNTNGRLGKGKIKKIKYSPDGTLLAVASGIGIWLYDTTIHQEITLLTEHTSAVSNIDFTPDGRFFASGSEDGVIILWDKSTGVRKKFNGKKSVSLSYTFAFSPDGKILASGSGDTVRFWDTMTGEHKGSLPGLPEYISYFSFSPDGEKIVSVTWGNEVCISDVITGKSEKTFKVENTDSVGCAALSPDGKVIAIGSFDGNIYLSDTNTGKLKRKLSGHSLDVQNIVFSPNGNLIASSSYVDETVRIWETQTGELERTLTEHMGDLSGLAFCPVGKTLASSGSGDGTIRFWDMHTGTQEHTITGHTGYTCSVAFNPNGNFIASGSDDGIIRFWDATTLQLIKTFRVSKNYVSSLTFTSDGKKLACGINEDIYLWDNNTDKFSKIISGHIMDVNSIALSTDGNILASGSADNTIRLWNMSNGKYIKTLTGHDHSINGVAFSPDGKTLVTGCDDNTIRLWDVKSGETKLILDANTVDGKNRGVMSVAYSPDGEILASGGMETIIIWDINTGKSRMTLTEHRHFVLCLSFSPDGTTLVSGSTDIHLWDPNTGKLKNTFVGHTAPVSEIAFSPDGKTLVSGSQDGTMLLWKIDP
ncbi:sigma-70 family RNA polymerase sigma factor [Candidatus Poribacteria bacterium]|nr:sigma-70 family RNA polymerase sigma factor [Candidatus Poribacteria bacterium]